MLWKLGGRKELGLKKRDDAHHCFVFNFFRMELRIGVERERERDMGGGESENAYQVACGSL